MQKHTSFFSENVKMLITMKKIQDAVDGAESLRKHLPLPFEVSTIQNFITQVPNKIKYSQ
jgi:hypothetical protein